MDQKRFPCDGAGGGRERVFFSSFSFARDCVEPSAHIATSWVAERCVQRRQGERTEMERQSRLRPRGRGKGGFAVGSSLRVSFRSALGEGVRRSSSSGRGADREMAWHYGEDIFVRYLGRGGGKSGVVRDHHRVAVACSGAPKPAAVRSPLLQFWLGELLSVEAVSRPTTNLSRYSTSCSMLLQLQLRQKGNDRTNERKVKPQAASRGVPGNSNATVSSETTFSHVDAAFLSPRPLPALEIPPVVTDAGVTKLRGEASLELGFLETRRAAAGAGLGRANLTTAIGAAPLGLD